jgi:Family of unknown function (DUF6114)
MIASTAELGPNRRVPGTAAVRWFRAFRRTRPFWGGLWLALGGVVVIKLNSYPMGVAMTGGFNRSAGYILGGAMVLFALVALASPLYARLVGVLGVLAAMAAFIGSNFGGFVVGSVLGILGGSMIWGWGELGPSRSRGTRRGSASGPEE